MGKGPLTCRYTSPSNIGPSTASIDRSACRRTSCGCAPRRSCRTPILAYSLRVEPEEHFVNWQQDPFGNHLARLVFPEPARLLSITVDLVADMTVINPFDFFLDPDAERYPFRYDAGPGPGSGARTSPQAEPGRLLRPWLAEVEVPPQDERHR